MKDVWTSAASPNIVNPSLTIEEKVKDTNFNDFFEKIENFLYKKKAGVADQINCSHDYQCYNGVNGKCDIEDSNCYYDTHGGCIKRRRRRTNKRGKRRQRRTNKRGKRRKKRFSFKK